LVGPTSKLDIKVIRVKRSIRPPFSPLFMEGWHHFYSKFVIKFAFRLGTSDDVSHPPSCRLGWCAMCQKWAAQYRVTDGGAHERRITYVWRFGYLCTVKEYRRITSSFLFFYAVQLLTARESLNLRLLDVNKLLLSYFSEHSIHLHVFAYQRFFACEKRKKGRNERSSLLHKPCK